MKLGIDLRFYRPEPYGLAVHIRDLFLELIPLIEQSTKFTSVNIILDKSIQNIPLEKYITWWNIVTASPKIEVSYVAYRYYSLAEQTLYLNFLNKLNCDLMFFFTFNYPIFYNKPFVYQVLDFSLPKIRSSFSLKVQAMLLCLNIGIRRARHTLLLGKSTRSDAEKFCNVNLTNKDKTNYKLNTVIYNGVSKQYLQTPTSNSSRQKWVAAGFSDTLEANAKEALAKYQIIKPYFFFVSVWRKYKNIERLVAAFQKFQLENSHRYQLVLGGTQDPKFPEVLEAVKNSPEYALGNIIVTGQIVEDQTLIYLYDYAEALVAPTLSEGFGLWMVEAASRGCPVICSDIPIFHEIAENDGAYFFDPYSIDSISQALSMFSRIEGSDKDKVIQNLQVYSQKFTWSSTANTIINILEKTDIKV